MLTKKFLISLLLLLLFISQALAEYKPIPKEKSLMYKKDIEQVISQAYPKIIHNIDNYTNTSAFLYNRIIKNNDPCKIQVDIISLTQIYEICLPAAELELYSELMKITQEKYLNTKYEPIGTDWVTPYEEFLQPYFRDNNIDTKILDKIVNYEIQQGKTIKKYIDLVNKTKLTDD